MKIKNGKVMQWLRLLHIVTASIWFGGVACVGVFVWICFFDMNQSQFLIAAPISTLLFSKLIFPAAMITLAQGIIYSAFTHWGFLKHKWVLLKWLGVVLLILCTAMGFMENMFLAMDKARTPDFVGGYADGGTVLIFLLAQVVIMVIMMALSVFKPLKKKVKKGN